MSLDTRTLKDTHKKLKKNAFVIIIRTELFVFEKGELFFCILELIDSIYQDEFHEKKFECFFKRRGKFMSYFRNIAVNQNSIFAELGFSNISKLSEYILKVEYSNM